jgi:uncharacterized membrane protein
MIRQAIARRRFGMPGLPLLALLAVVLAGCNQVGGQSMTFWDVIWSMVFFFFWFTFIWIFIALFSDIFRRDDLTGMSKALWLLLLIVLPFLGSLIYIIVRPKVTAGDVRRMTQMEAGVKAASAVSSTDQIAKLQELRAAGAITEAEFEKLKAETLA